MRHSVFFIVILFWSIFSIGQNEKSIESKYRLIVLADMGNEPDEMEQMIHMITCSNEFDIEGLIAVTGKYIRPNSTHGSYYSVTHPELFHNIINAYEKDLSNLKKHAKRWPEPEDLRKVVAAGQKGYGIEDVKAGNSSKGSILIMNALLKSDPRPIWVVVNAGSNTLAQALVDIKENYSKDEVNKCVSKLRVFENGAQDNAGAWICHEFPKIHWIRSNYQTYAYGGPGGIDGSLMNNLGPNYWTPYENTTKGQLEWLRENVMNNHGALGQLYPERVSELWGKKVIGFMEGGGTIPWMGLVNKGLFDINHPSWGGWGGRFSKRKEPDFWSRHKDIKVDEIKSTPFYTFREVSDHWVDPQNGKEYNDNYVPIWRWREAMYNDQLCRMDWCTKPFEKANHHPVAAYNGDLSNKIIRLEASAGEIISLDASASTDPDGDALNYSWWIYQEAGTYPGIVKIINCNNDKAQLIVPTGASGKQIHLILEIKDSNKIASLFDYRRIVIDVNYLPAKHEPVQDN